MKEETIKEYELFKEKLCLFIKNEDASKGAIRGAAVALFSTILVDLTPKGREKAIKFALEQARLLED